MGVPVAWESTWFFPSDCENPKFLRLRQFFQRQTIRHVERRMIIFAIPIFFDDGPIPTQRELPFGVQLTVHTRNSRVSKISSLLLRRANLQNFGGKGILEKVSKVPKISKKLLKKFCLWKIPRVFLVDLNFQKRRKRIYFGKFSKN